MVDAEPGGGAGAQQVSGPKPGVPGQVGQLFADVEDHVVGRVVLHDRAVERQPQPQPDGVGDLPGRARTTVPSGSDPRMPLLCSQSLPSAGRSGRATRERMVRSLATQ